MRTNRIEENAMDDTTKQAVKQRLASTAGHVKGIARMVDEDEYCIDIIKQIQAVQAALSKVSTLILDNHLHTCATSAIRGDDAAEREAVLKEITSVFEVSSKL
jgi:CsoR family transcriptional regulator, copper-sensing transcriptional repressor